MLYELIDERSEASPLELLSSRARLHNWLRHARSISARRCFSFSFRVSAKAKYEPPGSAKCVVRRRRPCPSTLLLQISCGYDTVRVRARTRTFAPPLVASRKRISGSSSSRKVFLVRDGGGAVPELERAHIEKQKSARMTKNRGRGAPSGCVSCAAGFVRQAGGSALRTRAHKTLNSCKACEPARGEAYTHRAAISSKKQGEKCSRRRRTVRRKCD